MGKQLKKCKKGGGKPAKQDKKSKKEGKAAKKQAKKEKKEKKKNKSMEFESMGLSKKEIKKLKSRQLRRRQPVLMVSHSTPLMLSKTTTKCSPAGTILNKQPIFLLFTQIIKLCYLPK